MARKHTKSHTLNDVKLAEIYFPILVELAKHKHRLTYRELIDEAKRLNPNDPIMESAIPVSTGRKLEVVHTYCVDHDLPILPSLIINKGTGEVGLGFADLEGVGLPETERKKVFAYDWSSVVADFRAYLSDEIIKATPKKKISREVAKKLMADHYIKHKQQYPASIKAEREALLVLIMEGVSVEQAFEEVTRG